MTFARRWTTLMNPSPSMKRTLGSVAVALLLSAGAAVGQQAQPGTGVGEFQWRPQPGARPTPPDRPVTPPRYQPPSGGQPFRDGFEPQPFRRPVDQIPGLIPTVPINRPVPRPPICRPPRRSTVIDPRIPSDIVSVPGYDDLLGPVVTEGSGLTVGGSYRSDQWRLYGRLSLANRTQREWNRRRYIAENGRYGPRDHGSDLGTSFINDTVVRIGDVTEYPGRVENPARRMRAQQIAAAMESAATSTTPAEPIELALWAMEDAKPVEAVKHYRTHLNATPDDAAAMRQFAVGLIEAGRLEDGVAMMRSAYRVDPSLADLPMTLDELGVDRSRLRNVLTRTVAFAHRSKSASAWLSVAVIMQAEGRPAQAAKMLDRAEKEGLDRDTASVLRASLERIP